MSLSESRPHMAAVFSSGRGGAGNIHALPPSAATASSPTSTHAHYLPPKPTAFFSGRGGAANAHPAAERTMFSFDEELERAQRHAYAPVYSIGRGGAGNIKRAAELPQPQRRERRESHSSNGSVSEEDAAPRASMSSERSGASSIALKIRSHISRH